MFSTFVWFIKTVDVLFTMGVIGMFQKSFLQKYRYVPAVFPLWFALSLMAVTIENNNFNHYYIQVMPGFIMTAVCGAAFMAFNLKRLLNPALSSAAVAIFLILSLLGGDYIMTKAGLNMLTMYPSSTVAEESVALYIKAHTTENDTILVPSYNKYIYTYSLEGFRPQNTYLY